jgi:hypothetical protein
MPDDASLGISLVNAPAPRKLNELIHIVQIVHTNIFHILTCTESIHIVEMNVSVDYV